MPGVARLDRRYDVSGREKTVDAIRKKIVTDEESRPVTVQIDYEDWLEIERLLENRDAGARPVGEVQDDFKSAADDLVGSWSTGSG